MIYLQIKRLIYTTKVNQPLDALKRRLTYLELNAHIESQGVGVTASILNLLQFVTQAKVHGLDKLNRYTNADSRSKIKTIKLACCIPDFSVNKGFNASAMQGNINACISIDWN